MQGHLIGCLLVGAGKMADDYLKVLQRLGVDTQQSYVKVQICEQV